MWIWLDLIGYQSIKKIKKKKNILDNYLINLGGTVFDNVISPGPDTPRAAASYFSGKPPWENGCDSRSKWPKFF